MLRSEVLLRRVASTPYIFFALLRVLLRIADGSPGAQIDRDDRFVTLPFGLVALYWVRMFKALVLDWLDEIFDGKE